MLTKKQILILFFISSDPGIRGISSLMKLFDRADFPANISLNLEVLLQNNLITVFESFGNGTAKKYKISENGKNFLIDNFNDSEIIRFVKSMDEPKLILEITKSYINKKNAK